MLNLCEIYLAKSAKLQFWFTNISSGGNDSVNDEKLNNLT